MTEPTATTKVDMSSATAKALLRRGGVLYVWVDSARMVHAGTNPPAHPIFYDTIYGEGWSVHVDREIKPPSRWVIKRKRLPWPRFEALYDPPESGWSRPTLGGLIEALLDSWR